VIERILGRAGFAVFSEHCRFPLELCAAVSQSSVKRLSHPESNGLRLEAAPAFAERPAHRGDHDKAEIT
jgi:hypothetical protein